VLSELSQLLVLF